MGVDTKDLVHEISLLAEMMLQQMQDSVSDKSRGQKAAAKRARKLSKEVGTKLLEYRKQSVKEIG